MFLLTEGTLFFLNLAHKTRTRNQRPSLRTVVQTWVDGVAAATDNTANRTPHTNTGASSDLTFSCVFNESTLQNGLLISKTSDCCAKDCHRGLVPTASDHDDDDVSSSVGDGSCRICSLDASHSQWQLESRRAIKRKLIDCTAEKHGRIYTRPSKRAKYEDPLAPSFSSPAGAAMAYLSAACMAHPQPLQRHLFNNEDYAIEMMKCFEFTLPVPCDQRWSHSFLSTAVLWYSVQKNIWSVPEEELTDALQHIFNVVYPGITYRVTPAGSVFKLTLRRINEWRSSFGSSALALMLHFFSALDDDDDIHPAAEFLSTGLRFLQEDPDSAEPTNTFRSPFLLLLIAITHLGDIDSFVDVPGWDTRAMAAGWDGEGVIALASVALERALRFICDGTLDVDQVLGEVPCYEDTSTTIGLSTHSNMVPNMFTARDAPPALRFSSANWSGPTAVYRESARMRGAMFVSETFAAARARRRRITGDADAELGANGSVLGVPDSHALAD